MFVSVGSPVDPEQLQRSADTGPPQDGTNLAQHAGKDHFSTVRLIIPCRCLVYTE